MVIDTELVAREHQRATPPLDSAPMRQTLFLSHAAADGALIRRLAHGLEGAGYASWYYERDSLPGPSYLSQILHALSHSCATVVLISPSALTSWQVDREVVQAHEQGLPFVPLLHGVTHAQVRAQRPEWVMMWGAAVAVPLPDDVDSVLPRIVAGLRWLMPYEIPAAAPAQGQGRVPAVLDDPLAPARTAPAVAMPAPPTPPTPLLGRERELASLSALLRQEAVRLVTLTGPGGVGKTRLGLQVAHDLRDAFDGVAFVALAPLVEAAQVPSAIAQALGLAEGDRPVTQRLQQALNGRTFFLLLDNVEHVREAAPFIADLLASCPQLTVLATSRVALRLSGEHEVAVPPLAVPDSVQGSDLATLRQYSAVALFIARAQEVKADFTITAANAPAIVEICVRLDGLPLAIELAAARIKLLTPQALLARLERRLPLLTGGARDLPDRHHTLRQAIAWSYDLLSPQEQALFRRLAVFVGGCTLEAVADVCHVSVDQEMDVLDGLAALLDNSLLQRSDEATAAADYDAEPRYTMLETIREYAWDALTEAGEADDLQRRHSAYFLALAEAAEPGVRAAGNRRWMKRLEAEHNNLRAALGWARQRQDADGGLRLSGALWWFWHLHGDISEGRQWLQDFLALRDADGQPAGSMAARAKALSGAGALAWSQGDHAEAAELASNSLTLFRTLGDQQAAALALIILGNAQSGRRDYARAASLYEDGLAIFRQLGDDIGSALALTTRGIVASNLGNLDQATALYEEALALAQRHDATWQVGNLLNNLGAVAAARGDWAGAAGWFKESLAVHSDILDTLGSALAWSNLGEVAHARGDSEQALAAYREALPLLLKVGHKEGLASCLAGVADIAVQRGHPEVGVRLCGAVAALGVSIDAAGAPLEGEKLDRITAAARAVLSESTYVAEWAAGLALLLPQAVRTAMAIAAA